MCTDFKLKIQLKIKLKIGFTPCVLQQMDFFPKIIMRSLTQILNTQLVAKKTPFWKWKIKMLLPKPPKYLQPIPSRTYEIPVSPMTTEHFKFLTFRLRVLSATQKIKNRSIFQKPDGPLFWPIFAFLRPPYRVFPETFCSENFVGGLCTSRSSKPYNFRRDWTIFSKQRLN